MSTYYTVEHKPGKRRVIHKTADCQYLKTATVVVTVKGKEAHRMPRCRYCFPAEGEQNERGDTRA